MLDALRFQPQDGLDMPFQVGEEVLVPDHAVFDDLRDAAAQFADGKRGQRIGVDQHHLRLQKSADHILPQRMIDADLAAHRAIDLRQQAGGHLHEADAAQVGGGHEAGEIADHPAAQRDHHRFAVDFALDEIAVEPGGGFHALIALAGGHQQGMMREPGALEAGAHGIPVTAVDLAIADHHDRTDGVRQPGRATIPIQAWHPSSIWISYDRSPRFTCTRLSQSSTCSTTSPGSTPVVFTCTSAWAYEG